MAEGKTKKEAIWSLKRKISDIVYRHLVADAQRLGVREDRRERLVASVAGPAP